MADLFVSIWQDPKTGRGEVDLNCGVPDKRQVTRLRAPGEVDDLIAALRSARDRLWPREEMS